MLACLLRCRKMTHQFCSTLLIKALRCFLKSFWAVCCDARKCFVFLFVVVFILLEAAHRSSTCWLTTCLMRYVLPCRKNELLICCSVFFLAIHRYAVLFKIDIADHSFFDHRSLELEIFSIVTESVTLSCYRSISGIMSHCRCSRICLCGSSSYTLW